MKFVTFIRSDSFLKIIAQLTYYYYIDIIQIRNGSVIAMRKKKNKLPLYNNEMIIILNDLNEFRNKILQQIGDNYDIK